MISVPAKHFQGSGKRWGLSLDNVGGEHRCLQSPELWNSPPCSAGLFKDILPSNYCFYILSSSWLQQRPRGLLFPIFLGLQLKTDNAGHLASSLEENKTKPGSAAWWEHPWGVFTPHNKWLVIALEGPEQFLSPLQQMFSHTTVSFHYDKVPFWGRCQTFSPVMDWKVWTFGHAFASPREQPPGTAVLPGKHPKSGEGKIFWLWLPAWSLDRKVGVAGHSLPHGRVIQQGKNCILCISCLL